MNESKIKYKKTYYKKYPPRAYEHFSSLYRQMLDPFYFCFDFQSVFHFAILNLFFLSHQLLRPTNAASLKDHAVSQVLCHGQIVL